MKPAASRVCPYCGCRVCYDCRAIAGRQARTAPGGHYRQQGDLVSLFRDAAAAFVQHAGASARVRYLIGRAVRMAKAERRVTALICPNDLRDEA
nr:hypothetical protein [uncultured Rhodopila sp.]